MNQVTPKISYEAREVDGDWTLFRIVHSEHSHAAETCIGYGLDVMQANVAAALLNGNEDLQVDNEGQCVIYTGYAIDPRDDGDRVSPRHVARYVPFEAE